MKKTLEIILCLIFIFGTAFFNKILATNSGQPAKPPQLIASPNDSICQGQNITLTLINPTGNLLWSTGLNTNSINVSPTLTTNYFVINDFGGSLQDTFYITITVFQKIKPIIFVNPNETVCKGDSVILTLSNPYNNFLWSTNLTSLSISFIADTVLNYYVINDAGGYCPDTTSVDLIIRDKKYTLIDIHGGFCPGVEVNINIINPKGAIVWNTGSNSSYLTVKPDTSTLYILINSAFTSCADTIEVEINIWPKTKANLSFSPADSICEGDPIQVRILNPVNSFIWSNGSMDTIQYVAASTSTGLSVINDYQGNCPDTTWVDINVIDVNSDLRVPNCFSPNGDGTNDVFKVSEMIKSDYKISIYNRWGIEVFESNAITRDWNGNFNSSPVADGIYYWILDFQNYCGGSRKTKKGFVSVFR